MSNDQSEENQILAKGADVAPRVMLAEIDEIMNRRVTYIGGRVGETTSVVMHAFLDGNFLLASGHSACVSVENFNLDLGISFASSKAASKAREQLWLLEGYLLRAKLNDPSADDFEDFAGHIQRWHTKSVEHIRNVSEQVKEGTVIKYGDSGVELKGREPLVFRLGVETALAQIGKLPFDIEPAGDEDDELGG
jgi:hypothetical protein